MENAPPGAVDLVPELDIADMTQTLDFYVGILGFTVLYDRPEHEFSYLGLGSAQIMVHPKSRWQTGPLEKPFGRGINFQINVPDLAAVLARLNAAGWPLFQAPEERWYRRHAEYLGVRQFLVQDPDGYLIRFSQRLGLRSEPPAESR
jgi:catechol 2,3-dioxygenase-like lactoylglutathione lyase family enzyme